MTNRGYVIQGIFGKHVRGIDGDFYNVMGFPSTAFRKSKIESIYNISFYKDKSLFDRLYSK